jgi:streptogramin lyase
MRAETAAAYCDERSVEAFTKRVGTVYPRAIYISGRGRVWIKEQLDRAIRRLSGETADVEDAANLL